MKEKWASMSPTEQAEVTNKVADICATLEEAREDFRLTEEFGQLIVSAILPIITKNHHTIHYFCQYCVEKELLPLKALEMCLVNYKKSIEDVSERRQEKKGELCRNDRKLSPRHSDATIFRAGKLAFVTEMWKEAIGAGDSCEVWRN